MTDIFLKHQVKIAKATLKMSEVGAAIMGGMTKEEARKLLKKDVELRKKKTKNRRKQ